MYFKHFVRFSGPDQNKNSGILVLLIFAGIIFPTIICGYIFKQPGFIMPTIMFIFSLVVTWVLANRFFNINPYVYITFFILILITMLPERFNERWAIDIEYTKILFKSFFSIIIIFLLFILSYIKNKLRSELIYKAFPFILAFLGVLSWLGSFSDWNFSSALYGLLLFVVPITSVFIMLKNFNKVKNIILMENIFLFITLVIYFQSFFIAMFPSMAISTFGWETYESIIARGRTTLGGANILAGFIIMMLPFLIKNNISSRNRIISIASFIAIFIGGFMIVRSQERMAFICYLVNLIICLGMAPRKKRWKISIIILIIIIFAIYYIPPYLIESRLLSSWRDSSFETRLAASTDALNIIKKSPLVGEGIGLVYPRWWEDRYMIFDGKLMLVDPHNLFLFLLAETGILGFIVFMVFIIKILVELLKNIIKTEDKIDKFNKSCYFATFFSYMVYSLSSSSIILVPQISISLWIITGLAILISRHPIKNIKGVSYVEKYQKTYCVH